MSARGYALHRVSNFPFVLCGNGVAVATLEISQYNSILHYTTRVNPPYATLAFVDLVIRLYLTFPGKQAANQIESTYQK